MKYIGSAGIGSLWNAGPLENQWTLQLSFKNSEEGDPREEGVESSSESSTPKKLVIVEGPEVQEMQEGPDGSEGADGPDGPEGAEGISREAQHAPERSAANLLMQLMQITQTTVTKEPRDIPHEWQVPASLPAHPPHPAQPVVGEVAWPNRQRLPLPAVRMMEEWYEAQQQIHIHPTKR